MNAAWFTAILVTPGDVDRHRRRCRLQCSVLARSLVPAQPWARDFYWGTFVINVSGSILLGVFAALFKDRAGAGFLLLGTGFCGGYTTFSTFSLEVAESVQRGRWDLAAIYVSTSVGGGFLGFRRRVDHCQRRRKLNAAFVSRAF